MTYIELHLHSQFSILDSTASIPKIVNKAKASGMSSIALTDHGNLFGIVDFYKACQKEGIHPIIGAELWLAPESRSDKKKIPGVPAGSPIVLLAENRKGYQNLCKLSSIGYLEGFYYYPRIDKEVLAQHTEGLICLSGSTHSYLSFCVLNRDPEEVEKEVEWFARHFPGKFYLELQRHAMTEDAIRQDHMDSESWVVQNHRDFVARQNRIIEVFTELGKKMSLPLVATNDVHYVEREDYAAHEILLNVQSGEPCEIWERDSHGNPKVLVPNPKRKIYPSHEFYLKTPSQMQELFSDLPQAIANTKVIAEQCCCELDFKTKHYPVYLPEHLEGKEISKEEREEEAGKYLYQLCVDGIGKRYTPERLEKVKEFYPDEDPLEVVKKRLDYEFEILSSKGMCDYLLIVYDFIHWAKQQGIPVGPGRGSAAGSIISYLMGITDIEPLRFHLFFERFINPERVSYPDIDVDICMERRSEVIDYTIRKYGKDKVAQIITFGTMKAKMAIKDVGRVLSIPLAKVNAIAKLVPEDPNMTLEKALSIDPELANQYKIDEETKRIIDIAKKLEGSIRNTGIHAAGLIVCQDPLTDHIPVCTAKDADIIVTQYAMKPVESVGMLKIDFLGLKTLSAIQKAAKAAWKNHQAKVDISNLSLENKPCFNLLNHGKTLGVFQLESGGMQELAKKLHIDNFEEIIAVGALYRPGPMDMIPSFINRKHGRETIEIDHPLMKDILKETYGVMVYQEQVMQIASKLAGYSLGEGDVLRRAMGKKDKEEMQRQRKKFLEGAKGKGITEQTAITIFDKIEKFASYGFNKSHAAAYAYLSYVTAYLKANFPKEWMAALMTCDHDDLSKVAKFIRECKSMQIRILPPDINEAALEFAAAPEGIRFAMSGIKGVGTSCVEAIVEEREKSGSYQSLYDFVQRVDKTRVTKKNIEVLIDAGGFDFTKWTRDALKLSVDAMYDEAMRQQKEDAKGVMNLFSLLEESDRSPFLEPPTLNRTTPKEQILHREKELLGFYLTGHPMDNYRSILGRLSCVPLRDFEILPEEVLVRTAFIVETVQFKVSSKTQKKFAIMTISDGIERLELPIWPDMYEEKSHLLRENQLLYAILHLDRKEGRNRANCRYLEDLSQIDETKITECDDLFDRLKSQMKRREKAGVKKATTGVKKTMPEEKKEQKPFHLKVELDADQTRLSQIMQIKKLFCENAGKSPVTLSFRSQGQTVGNVEIGSSWGAEVNDSLEEKLKKFPIVTSIRRDAT